MLPEEYDLPSRDLFIYLYSLKKRGYGLNKEYFQSKMTDYVNAREFAVKLLMESHD